MEDYSEHDLIQASVIVTSLIHKCEKSLEKLTEKTPQRTLLINRIRGLKISLTLIEKEIKQQTTN